MNDNKRLSAQSCSYRAAQLSFHFVMLSTPPAKHHGTFCETTGQNDACCTSSKPLSRLHQLKTAFPTTSAVPSAFAHPTRCCTLLQTQFTNMQ
jgi:hypothetical protein